MLFNSYIFIFLFLPCVIAGYFSINKNISNEMVQVSTPKWVVVPHMATDEFKFLPSFNI